MQGKKQKNPAKKPGNFHFKNIFFCRDAFSV